MTGRSCATESSSVPQIRVLSHPQCFYMLGQGHLFKDRASCVTGWPKLSKVWEDDLENLDVGSSCLLWELGSQACATSMACVMHRMEYSGSKLSLHPVEDCQSLAFYHQLPACWGPHLWNNWKTHVYWPVVAVVNSSPQPWISDHMRGGGRMIRSSRPASAIQQNRGQLGLH